MSKNIGKFYKWWLERITRFFYVWKQTGLRTALGKAMNVLIRQPMSRKQTISPGNTATMLYTEKIQEIITALNVRELQGVFVLTSAFPFDEFYNQRVINLTKFLAQSDWGVLYIAWRWSPEEKIEHIFEEVYPNVFQLPVDLFVENLSPLKQLIHEQKFFVIELPHPMFFECSLQLRNQGFVVIYEIIDEWEEFHKVGQAPWFEKTVERAFVINANIVTAVSTPLIEKFSDLRLDIHLIPNGYAPEVIGTTNQLITQSKFRYPYFRIGYFGHLTASWFDWDFIFQVLEHAQTNNLSICFEIIGYGGPDLEKKLSKYQENIIFHGAVMPSDLYKYARRWDIAIIPFKSSKLSEAVDPIKVYEYLYFGLPVIVKGISHLESLSPLIQVVRTPDDFLASLSKLYELSQQGRLKQILRETANTQLANWTWEKRFSELLWIIEAGKWISF